EAFAEQARIPLGGVAPRRPRRGPLPWLAAAAVVLVALGVPLWLLLDGDGDVALPATTTSPSATGEQPRPPLSGLPAPGEGWKWVSRHDVAVQVPEEWRYDDYAWSASSWCINGKSEPDVPEAPFVSSPLGAVAAIACPELQPEWVQMHLEWMPVGVESGTPLT